MPTVHVFAAPNRFQSSTEILEYIEPASSHDGDLIPSGFMVQTGLQWFEPACIETMHRTSAMPLRRLIRGASYLDQWIDELDTDVETNAAILVYEPNVLESPQPSELTYCGAFEYHP